MVECIEMLYSFPFSFAFNLVFLQASGAPVEIFLGKGRDVSLPVLFYLSVQLGLALFSPSDFYIYMQCVFKKYWYSFSVWSNFFSWSGSAVVSRFLGWRRWKNFCLEKKAVGSFFLADDRHHATRAWFLSLDPFWWWYSMTASGDLLWLSRFCFVPVVWLLCGFISHM